MPAPAYTAAQQSYLASLNRQLRRLALARGESFAVPHTIEQAKTEVARLKHRRPSSSAERAMDRDGLSAARRTTTPATAIRDDEVTGYGSNCRWSH